MIRRWILIGLILILGIGQISIADVNPNLVGWWMLDETSGNIAADSSGYGNHGIVSGSAEWVSGIKDGALLFDGQEDYIDCGKDSSLDINSSFTASVWVKNNALLDKIKGILMKSEGDSPESYGNQGWEFIYRSQAIGYRFYIRDENNNSPRVAAVLSEDAQAWHHFAGVYDDKNNIMKLYVDGIEQGTTNADLAAFNAPGSSFKIGTIINSNYFNGLMDDVCLYNRALLPAEIEELVLIGQSNDDCRYAEPIGEVTDLAFDTTNAKFDGPGICMVSPNLWYCYTASCTGQATVSLCGSQYDTMLAVYNGGECECYPAIGDLIGCNDDFCHLQSQLTFNVVAGNQYLNEIGGYRNREGPGVLTITCEGEAPSTFCQDLNGDGKVDFDDLITLIMKWLEGCIQ